MPKWLNDAITETNNHTFDMVRILAILSVANFIFLVDWEVMVNHIHFDMVTYGVSIGSVLLSAGKALQWKPESKDNNV